MTLGPVPLSIAPDPRPAGDRRILDLTDRPRKGFRGPGVPDWCALHGLPLPDQVNTLASAGGLSVARLGRTEILILSDSDAPLTLPAPGPGVFDAWRDEGWLWYRFQGQECREAMAALGAVDLRPSAAPAGCVLQTRVAGLDTVLAIRREGEVCCIDLFADIASAEYLEGVFRDQCHGWPMVRPGVL